jgi:hypothetical protein
MLSSHADLEATIGNQRELALGARTLTKNLCRLIGRYEEVAKHPELRGYVLMLDEISSKFYESLVSGFLQTTMESLLEQKELAQLAHQDRVLILNHIDVMGRRISRRDDFLYQRVRKSWQNGIEVDLTKAASHLEERLQEIQAKADSILDRLDLPGRTPRPSPDSDLLLEELSRKVDYIHSFFSQEGPSDDASLAAQFRFTLQLFRTCEKISGKTAAGNALSPQSQTLEELRDRIFAKTRASLKATFDDTLAFYEGLKDSLQGDYRP